MKPSTLSFLLLSSLVSARTDLDGCVSTEVVINWGASYLWYVPGTGEICTFLDCGGGRAPPKTDQPGCPLYSGTATVTASYIDGYGPSGKQAASTTTAEATSTAAAATATATSTSAESSSAAASESESVSESESSASSSASESSSESSASGTQSGSSGSMITAAPISSPAVSMTTTMSPSSVESTTSSTPTDNAANIAASNVGVVAMVAMLGAMIL